MDIVIGMTETMNFIVENGIIIIVQMIVPYDKIFLFYRFQQQESTNIGECLEDTISRWK